MQLALNNLQCLICYKTKPNCYADIDSCGLITDAQPTNMAIEMDCASWFTGL